jgi:hypothetical protein
MLDGGGPFGPVKIGRGLLAPGGGAGAAGVPVPNPSGMTRVPVILVSLAIFPSYLSWMWTLYHSWFLTIAAIFALFVSKTP